MSRPLVVVTDCDLPSDGGAVALLEDAGCAVQVASCRTADDVAEAARDAAALIVQWAPVDGAVLDAAPGVRMISRLGIGCDMIDIDAATGRGVAVANTPDYCIEEVALHTVALALAQLRGIARLDAAVRADRWSVAQDAPHAVRASRTTVAVVGYGRIGSSVARAFGASGFRVLVCDPQVSPSVVAAAGHEPATLDEALAAANLVTLHLPLTAATHHLLDADRLATLPPGAHVVNTCRGGLIDEAALAEALAAGRLGGAALDVFEQEPLAADSPLRALPNVLLSPHGAWYSIPALAELPRRAAENVIEFLAGRAVPQIINPNYLPIGA